MRVSMGQKVCRWGLAATLACAAAMANAAVVVVRWDPLFNLSFSTQLGWQGEAFINVAEDCLTPGGTFLVGSPACTSAELDHGTLSFYGAPGTPLTLSWDKDDPGFNAEILIVRTNGTDVTGFVTAPTIEFDNQTLNGLSVDIDLLFVINPFNGYSGPLLALTVEQCNTWGYHDHCSDRTFLSSMSTNPNDPTAPRVTFSRVPEPDSLALFGLALVAGAWARRRFGVRLDA